VSDAASDSLNLLFRSDVGKNYMRSRRKLDDHLLDAFSDVGISGLANIVAAIKVAKYLDFGPNDVVMTVATDSAALYASEAEKFAARKYADGFDELGAGEVFSRHMAGVEDDHVLELRHLDRKRIFNLGYYTWVEQQGISLEDFDSRKSQEFWNSLVGSIPAWDHLITEFNAEVGGTNA
jgi:hypothetical protein